MTSTKAKTRTEPQLDARSGSRPTEQTSSPSTSDTATPWSFSTVGSPIIARPSSALRDVALERMLGSDARSVAATTRFLARNEQPMESVRALEAIEVPVLVLPGVDPQHPADLAALYARHLRRPVVVAQNAPDTMEAIIQSCSDLDWNLSK